MAVEELHGLPVMSWKAQKLRALHRQQLEFTCGAASLSTVARFFLGQDASEQQVVEIVRRYYSDEASWKAAQKEGLSFLDLKRAAVHLGLSADAYHLTLAQLSRLSYPVIVHLDKGGYQHFSVVKGVSQGRVWLADPVRGNVRDSIRQFEKEWAGLVLVVWDTKAKPVADSELSFTRDVRLGEEDLHDSFIRNQVGATVTFSPYRR